ncbi:MAG TPA: FAD:protein FMN transferase [Gammaproteobacteria bacterium]|nr:FAD:protein FMN transferase [Gammaproteobacteria bacterium]
MRFSRWLAAALLVLPVLLAACEKQNLYRYQSFAFGTLIEIKIHGDDKAQADQAAASLFTDFDRMHNDWHAWQPGKLTQTSALLATGEWFTADKAVLPLIKLSKQYSQLSNGLFNPTIGKLIRSWGFQGSEQPQTPPSQKNIARLLDNLPTVNDIDIDGNRLRGHNPQIQLDLGAIAKGYAVSIGLQKMRDLGIKHALINAGGDLCGIGDRGQRPWRIGIRNPLGNGIIASLELGKDECVFTSGDYERYFTYEGKRYNHIIDPRTGYPADQVVSVTVLHKNGALADAASTALFVAGPDYWQEVAKKMGVSDVMLVDKLGRIIMTPSMQQRIKLENNEEDREIIISKPQPDGVKKE